MLNAPVAFFIFNRPEVAKLSFEKIRLAQPKRLFVIADGPRPSHPEDRQRCLATRSIVDRIDWDCNIDTDFSEINLGCGKRMATGLTWVFEKVDRAIIIEDDCVANPSFFRFCEELLEAYHDDEHIQMITGTNLYCNNLVAESYYFASYSATCWGWASWARAWKHFDYSMQQWSDPAVREGIRTALDDDEVYRFFCQLFDSLQSGQRAIWDYQWDFARLVNAGKSIVPAVNLVQNIGFGLHGGTHTWFALGRSVPAQYLAFPLRHPSSLEINIKLEKAYFRKARPKDDPMHTIGRKIKQLIQAKLSS